MGKFSFGVVVTGEYLMSDRGLVYFESELKALPPLSITITSKIRVKLKPDFDKDWPKSEQGRYLCTKDKPMPNAGKLIGRWEHEEANETDYDSEYEIQYKCASCGHKWYEEMPQ